MDYYCGVCDKFLKPESEYKHFKSKSHQEFDKCKHIELSLKDIDINDVNETFHLYNFQHNKKNRFLPREMFLMIIIIVYL